MQNLKIGLPLGESVWKLQDESFQVKTQNLGRFFLKGFIWNDFANDFLNDIWRRNLSQKWFAKRNSNELFGFEFIITDAACVLKKRRDAKKELKLLKKVCFLR